MNKPEKDQADKARAIIESGMSAEDLLLFCQNIERLFRMNPYLEIMIWESDGKKIHVLGFNQSNQKHFELAMHRIEEKDGFSLSYDEGIKTSTRFQFENTGEGCRLTITDFYREEVEETGQLEEVDKSLIPWGREISRVLVLYKRWGWLKPWKWYMDNVWVRMKPVGRRVAYILFWLIVAEFLLFVLIWTIYQLET